MHDDFSVNKFSLLVLGNLLIELLPAGALLGHAGFKLADDLWQSWRLKQLFDQPIH
jgi:hypothetical protein